MPSPVSYSKDSVSAAVWKTFIGPGVGASPQFGNISHGSIKWPSLDSSRSYISDPGGNAMTASPGPMVYIRRLKQSRRTRFSLKDRWPMIPGMSELGKIGAANSANFGRLLYLSMYWLMPMVNLASTSAVCVPAPMPPIRSCFCRWRVVGAATPRSLPAARSYL